MRRKTWPQEQRSSENPRSTRHVWTYVYIYSTHIIYCKYIYSNFIPHKIRIDVGFTSKLLQSIKPAPQHNCDAGRRNYKINAQILPVYMCILLHVIIPVGVLHIVISVHPIFLSLQQSLNRRSISRIIPSDAEISQDLESVDAIPDEWGQARFSGIILSSRC